MLLALSLTSCGGGEGGTGPDPDDAVASVTVSPPTATVDVGGTTPLTATVRNGRGEVVSASVGWSSSATGVATVSQTGVVTGVSEGPATITASASGRTGTAAITVNDPNPPAAPSNVTASPVSNTVVEVSWQDNSNNEDGFVIEREVVGALASPGNRDGDGPLAVKAGDVGPNATSFQDTDLTPGTSYQYSVTACNDNGCSESAGGSGEDSGAETYETAVIVTTELPAGQVGVAYSQDLEISETESTVAWTLEEGALPDGLSLLGGGTISGTPTAAGTFDFTVQARADGQTPTQELSIVVTSAPAVTTTSLPNAITGVDYEEVLEASGGDGTYAWEIIGGALPAGLELAADGTISGAATAAPAPSHGPGGPGGPAAVGTSEFTVQATSGGLTGQADLSITVFDPLAVTTAALSGGLLDEAYGEALAATGGDGAYQWSLAGGTLPEGLTLNANGTITGVPTALGTADFTARVTSGDEQVATADLSITITEEVQPPVVTTTELADGGVGAAYGQTLQATGGDGDYAWAVTEGTLPAGLALDGTSGEISGEATTPGTVDFTVEVTSADMTGEADLSITVHGELAVTSAGALDNGVEGAPYSATVQTAGGSGENAFALSDGALPTGLALNESTGEISGTPTAAPPPAPSAGTSGDGPAAVGASAFSVTVTNTVGQMATADLSITVFLPLSVTTTTLGGGTVDEAYADAVAATGGDAPYAWSITAGDLPDGLALTAATGAITGTPTEPGTFDFTVQAASADGQVATADLSITIVGEVMLESHYLEGGYVSGDNAYSLFVGPATGGEGDITYAVTDGTLPPGLDLDEDTGEISGTPTTAGVYFFEITASSGGADASALFTISISTNPPTGFNVWVHNVADEIPIDEVIDAIDAAVARWEAIITGNYSSFTTPAGGLDDTFCQGNGSFLNEGFIDDVSILSDIASIDGPFMILGSAGLCGFIRGGDAPLTWSGSMRFDADDLARTEFKDDPEALFNLVFHEMGHIMGIGGSDWHALRSGDFNSPPITFTGAAATVEHGTLGGVGSPLVEEDGGAGTRESHWDEEFFDTEIMTGFAESVAEQISRLTIGAMEDLFWSVSYSTADAYSIPACSPSCAPPRAVPGGDPTDAQRARDIVISETLLRLEPDGTVIRMEPARRGGGGR
jgi:hypothetical protein